VSLNLSVCLESSGACELTVNVLKENKLTKPSCNLTEDFVIKGWYKKKNPFHLVEYAVELFFFQEILNVHYTCLVGFSLEKWLEDKDYRIDSSLPSYAVSELLHDLDIIQYLGDSVCNRNTRPFHPSKNGWNNGLYHCHLILKFDISSRLYKPFKKSQDINFV
jgi:hypothetical protein